MSEMLCRHGFARNLNAKLETLIQHHVATLKTTLGLESYVLLLLNIRIAVSWLVYRAGSWIGLVRFANLWSDFHQQAVCTACHNTLMTLKDATQQSVHVLGSN